ncbi:MAG: hypothetical protein OXC46_10870, partial [Thaumarchaeota archaeon]|nr:hypothetical protein [Nitrososphaerota archaeon]
MIDKSDYSAIVDFCKCLEIAISIMRLTADNSMQKMTLDDYQQGLFDIMQAAKALVDNPRNESKQHDLENAFKVFLKKLECHIV